MEFNHIPVLFQETVDSLNIKPDGIYVDGTVGGAGHSREIASRLTSGRLIAFDQDPEAVAVASGRLEGLSATVVHSNFKNMKSVLMEMGIEAVDGILLDLGVSSHQLDTAERGFSFHKDAPLDMRMSGEGTTAADLVNSLSAEELSNIFFRFGEEKFSRRIAERIVNVRADKPITTTTALAELIASAVPAAARRCFQALRIAVNGELDILSGALDDAFSLLKCGGVLSVISFHSLEDRIVKQSFREYCTGCICPPDIPVCVCGRKPQGKLLTRKPIEASSEELKENPRSRSAKLRSIVKL